MPNSTCDVYIPDNARIEEERRTRDMFAAHALSSLVAACVSRDDIECLRAPVTAMATLAYRAADAMMAERARRIRESP